ncbi:MAG TPA: macrolide family glycosyltransferase [Polyangiaceae bacterium]|nr:macrolide family glycosyltransferase [Polyangiaceae bacterium]
MRYAFFIVPATGHLTPTLAVAQELVARGEEVVYYLPPREEPSVERTGATFRALGPAFKAPDENVESEKATSFRESAPIILRNMAEALRATPALVERVRAEAPDCIVYDPNCLWGRLVAEALPARRAVFHTTYVMTDASPHSPTPRGRPSFDVLRALVELLWAAELLHWRHGFSRFRPSQLVHAAEGLNLVPLPKSFQADADRLDDDRYVFFGPSIGERGAPDDFPLERLEGKPTLYISLGTTLLGRQPHVYKACFEAFGGSAWQGVLATSGMSSSQLGPAPDNFIVRGHVPQLAVLERAQVFITHGGMGSTMEALWHGVPLVVLPQIPEQEVTAARVEELGLGVSLASENVRPDALRRAVETVRDPAYKARALAMQAAVRGAGGYARGADALQRYVAR